MAARIYIQIPPRVKAIQWDGTNHHEIWELFKLDPGTQGDVARVQDGGTRLRIWLRSEDGHSTCELSGRVGDYWCKDALGERYVHRQKEFEVLYQEAK